jgi:hypothetical protein
MTLLDHRMAFDYLKDLLRQGYKVKMVTPLNKGRHLLIEYQKHGSERYYYFYAIFKHTFMHSFNQLFKHFVDSYPEFEGQGESINVEFLEYARRREATLLFIYPDGSIYQIESNLVKNFCMKNDLVRTQERRNEYLIEYGNGSVEVVNETTYTFPIKLMSRFY